MKEDKIEKSFISFHFNPLNHIFLTAAKNVHSFRFFAFTINSLEGVYILDILIPFVLNWKNLFDIRGGNRPLRDHEGHVLIEVVYEQP